VQDGSGLGLDQNSKSIRNRVIHRDELKLKITHDLNITLAHGVGVGRQAMLFELGFNKSQCERRSNDGNVSAHTQKVRDSPDVIFVAVS
jgi:hypothetical protein